MRPVKFAVVGVLNTAVDFVAFNVLATLIGMPIIAANVASYSLGVINSYVWNRRWTFGDRPSDRRRSEFVRFVVANIAGAGINTALVWGALTLYHALVPAADPAADSPVTLAAAKALAIVGSMVFNYTVFHRWVFVPGTSDVAQVDPE
ncbi:MAG: GtrA family protein [Coriobacteriia bacterium]|nr:GtrA family protein [Coriobacteriia bacterium]